jgi:hypothetical protein
MVLPMLARGQDSSVSRSGLTPKVRVADQGQA